MTETTPNEAEPAGSAEQAIQPPKVADPGREPPKERQYASEHPLYFRAVFGKEGTDSTLGVLDECAGTGTGYNVAYVDENRNGDLTDDAAKKFAKIERGSRTGQTDPSFNFSGPLPKSGKAHSTHSTCTHLPAKVTQLAGITISSGLWIPTHGTTSSSMER